MSYDQLVTCPYDESHRILKSRMAFHLTRCAKNHKNSKKKVCPFDVRHIIDPSDYSHHVETCPQRETVLHFSFHDSEKQREQQKLMNILPVPTPDMIESIIPKSCSENWDDDPEVKSYNPNTNIENKKVIRNLIGASKSEKKRFREEERRRLQQLENEHERREKQRREKERQDKIAADLAEQQKRARGKPKDATDKSENETELRRPKKQSETKILNRSLRDISEAAEANKEVKTESEALLSSVEPVLTKKHGAISKHTAVPTAKEENTDSTTTAPFSYAAAVNKSNETIKATANQSMNNSFNIVESEDNKENDLSLNDSSYLTASINTSQTFIDKVTEDVDQLSLDDEGFQKVMSRLDKKLNTVKHKTTEVASEEQKVTRPRKIPNKSCRNAATFPKSS